MEKMVHNMNRYIRFVFAGLLAVGAPHVAAQSLNVGMQAPPIKVGAWVKSAPVKEFTPGQIYVVEFWATWCHPCIENIPHLTQMARDYAGQVTVIGISIQETDFAKVAPFVKRMGDQMQYHVAYDSTRTVDEPGFMERNWMTAAGMVGIPAVFIVGRTGEIEFMGAPDKAYAALKQIVSGTWDTATYDAVHAWIPSQAKYEADREEWEKTTLGMQVHKVQKLVEDKLYQEALAELNVLGAMPGTTKHYDSSLDAWRYPKIYACSEKMGLYAILGDMDGYYRAADECVDAIDIRTADGSGRGDWMDYKALAWFIVGPGEGDHLSRKDYDFALKVAKRGVETAEKRNDTGQMDYETLAWAYYRKGDKAKAIAAQKKALQLVADNPIRASREESKGRYQKNLAIFQAMRK